MSTRAAMSNSTLESAPIPPLHTAHQGRLAPPLPTSLGRAFLNNTAMGNHDYHDGVGHPRSDTPAGSTPSTAPSSPRL